MLCHLSCRKKSDPNFFFLLNENLKELYLTACMVYIRKLQLNKLKPTQLEKEFVGIMFLAVLNNIYFIFNRLAFNITSSSLY